jgi:hypothetical protein
VFDKEQDAFSLNFKTKCKWCASECIPEHTHTHKRRLLEGSDIGIQIDMGNCGWEPHLPPQKEAERMSYNHLHSYSTTTTNNIQIYIRDREIATLMF